MLLKNSQPMKIRSLRASLPVWAANVELTLRTCMKVMGPTPFSRCLPDAWAVSALWAWDKKSGAKCPVFFPLLDNVASMLAGIKLHYERIGRKVNVVAFAGDGASVDAGMQCLSGAAERGDKIIYICYDNEGYMNPVISAAAPPRRGPGPPPPPLSTAMAVKSRAKRTSP